MRVAQVVLGEGNFGWLWQPPQLSILSQEYWRDWMTWAMVHNLQILLWMIILLLLIEMRLRHKRYNSRSWWRGKMTHLWNSLPKLNKKQERAYIDQMVEDILVDGVESAVYENRLTREQAKCVYMRMYSYAGLKGLLPRTDQEKLKGNLQNKFPEGKKEDRLGSAFKSGLKTA